MRQFKAADLTIQLLLLGVYGALAWRDGLEMLIQGYLVVGGWHIISMAVHALTGWQIKKPGTRITYHWISFIAVVTLPIGSFWILAVLGAPMAIFYTTLCAREYYRLSTPDTRFAQHLTS